VLKLISEWSGLAEVSLQDAYHRSENYLAESTLESDFIPISIKRFMFFFGQINSKWSLGSRLANFYVTSYRYRPLYRS
jgi:hypothetical protein